MKTHKLKILSLHDAQAICTCGHWSITCTGERTKEYLQEEFNKYHTINKGNKDD